MNKVFIMSFRGAKISIIFYMAKEEEEENSGLCHKKRLPCRTRMLQTAGMETVVCQPGASQPFAGGRSTAVEPTRRDARSQRLGSTLRRAWKRAPKGFPANGQGHSRQRPPKGSPGHVRPPSVPQTEGAPDDPDIHSLQPPVSAGTCHRFNNPDSAPSACSYSPGCWE